MKKNLQNKHINTIEYMKELKNLNVDNINLRTYSIVQDSRVMIDYPTWGHRKNMGALSVFIVDTKINDNFILEKFIAQTYAIKGFDDQAWKNYSVDTILVHMKNEEVIDRFNEWFDMSELEKLNINFKDITESVYMENIYFFDTEDLAYKGSFLFVCDNYIYHVEYQSIL